MAIVVGEKLHKERLQNRNTAEARAGRICHAIKGIRSRNEMILMLDGWRWALLRRGRDGKGKLEEENAREEGRS